MQKLLRHTVKMPIPQPMQYSQSGLRLTQGFEGCKLLAYRNKGDVWTIGFGHTRGVKEGDTCDMTQAVIWLQEDVAFAVKDVNRIVEVQLTQGEFDACVDFAFNCGCNSFDHSTLLKLINKGDFEHAANEFAKWDHAGGIEVAGLLRRRLAEKGEFEA
jgi:lysozyme